MCFDFLYKFFCNEICLILRSIERDVVKYVPTSSCKVPVIRVRFYWNLKFLDRFSKNTQISNFVKIRLVGADLFHADGRTDSHDEANSRFPQFCEAAWKGKDAVFNPTSLCGGGRSLTSAMGAVEWSTSCSSLFTPGKEPRYTSNRNVGGSLSRRSVGIQAPDRPVRSLADVLAPLYRFREHE